jgi:phosphoserine phosphatase|tara:strand:- start:19545 stop:20753 length:1209 start_codon:yes stop_codon:yes gene_type:complete
MQNVILINVTGQDRPGLTAKMTQILAQAGMEVLDMGQSVIHDYLTLGILVRTAPEQNDAIDQLKSMFVAEGLSVEAEVVTNPEYADWVSRQGQKRMILTILGRKITAAQLSRLARIVTDEGLNIDHINRLSGRVPLEPSAMPARACLEWSLRGSPSPLFRKKLMALATELTLDLAVQEDGIYRRHRRLIAFDMDSTLIETEVIDELAKRKGVGAAVAEITHQAMSGELDFQESLIRRVAQLKGLPETILSEVAAHLPLTEGVESLFKTLKLLGYKTAILSGGFDYFGQALQAQLGVDHVFANRLEIKDGLLTGRVLEPIVDAEAKARILRALAEQEGISMAQTIAVGDGANDLEMLGAAGLGIAYHAKDLVRERSRHAISTLGLDSILYLLGISDRDQFGVS